MAAIHEDKLLSAYCNGLLPPGDASRVAAHLLECRRCREAYDEIKFGARLAATIARREAPATLWSDVERALDGAAGAETDDRSRPGGRGIFALAFGPARMATAVAALCIVVGAIAFFTVDRESRRALERAAAWRTGQSWSVSSLSGSPKIDADAFTGDDRIGVGEWLETDDASRARIQVADIGQVEVGPNSRIGLVESTSTEHRLSLERGSLRALVVAPPRLFLVDTPTATAVDYGCAYTLTVADDGSTTLRVTSGFVALVLDGREAMAPTGAVCVSRPGCGPGTPYFEDASEAFRSALASFDFADGGETALAVILAQARERDTLTLWHLLRRVGGADRERVFARAAALVPPPKGVTREKALALDSEAMERWGEEITGLRATRTRRPLSERVKALANFTWAMVEAAQSAERAQ